MTTRREALECAIRGGSGLAADHKTMLLRRPDGLWELARPVVESIARSVISALAAAPADASEEEVERVREIVGRVYQRGWANARDYSRDIPRKYNEKDEIEQACKDILAAMRGR